MDDRNIIELFFSRNEDAIRQSSDKYGRYCYSIAYGILGLHEDAEECVNDTWVRAWSSIPPQRPNSLRAFLGRITRNLSIDRYRKGGGKRRCEADVAIDELAECLPCPDSDADQLHREELVGLINRFLRGLPARERQIFIARFFFVHPVKKIAKETGIKEKTVFNTVTLTKKKLAAYLEKEGFKP